VSTVVDWTARSRLDQGFPPKVENADVLLAAAHKVLALVCHGHDDVSTGKPRRPAAREGGGRRASA
jgi:hypothetical protein